MIGIYKITSPSKKVYIGQSINIEKRFYAYKKLHCKNQIILYNSLLKYGVDKHKFETICECDISELNEKERYYQDLYCALSKVGLNCKLTTASDRSGTLSDETKAKMRGERILSESLKNKFKLRKSFLGKKHTEQSKEKIRLANLGKKLSEETKLKMKGKKHTDEAKKNIGLASKKNWTKERKEKVVERMLGNKYSLGIKRTEDFKIKISKANKGKKLSNKSKDKIRESKKHLSKESRARISQGQKGRKFSEEHKQRLIEAWKKRKAKALINNLK